jgi:hypothetical protein
MSKRAVEFFEAWVLEHVNPVQFREHTAEASRLTDLCIEDARKVGIAQAEIEEELYQNLYDELRDRMDARTTEAEIRLESSTRAKRSGPHRFLS